MKTLFGTGLLALVLSAAVPVLARTEAPEDRIGAALERARQAGIPVALLESKRAEGKAKGVPIERIAAAVERRLAALERARHAMDGSVGVGATDLSVAADALDSGVSEAVLKTIAETAPRERRAVAIAALTQLVQLGHVPEAALGRVRDALQRGPEALAKLPAEAAAGRGAGRPPAGQGRGRGVGSPGVDAGPPSGVPAPGDPSEATRPGGPPARPDTPAPPRAGGRGRP